MSTPPAGSSKIVGNFRESEREDLQLWFKRDRDACLHTSDFVIFILSVFSFEEEGPAFFLDLTFALIWAAGLKVAILALVLTCVSSEGPFLGGALRLNGGQ